MVDKIDKAYLLNDEQMRNFIVNGYVTVKADKADFPAGFHETIYQKTKAIFEKDGNPGNNLLPRIPEIQEVFEHPAIRGALTSILGPTYIIHSHCHPHHNPPNSGGQNLHKDSYWGYQKVRHHCPRWIMAFYYPQDVTMENGPSAVLPGSQYYNTRSNDNSESEVELPILGEAGTVTILHFDLWHRATPNRTDKSRFMMKFQFVRMQDPKRPSWNSKDPLWHPVEDEDVEDVGDNDKALFEKHQALWMHIWNWLHGRKAKKSSVDALGRSGRSGRSGIMAQGQGAQNHNHRSNLSALLKRLSDGSEPLRLDTAYELALLGSDAVPALIEALRNDSEPTRLAAAYGLGAVGSPAISALMEALSDKSEPVRRYASYALAQMGQPAQEAVAALSQALSDESNWVRQNATEALGIIGQLAKDAVPALIASLSDKDGLVRANAVLALAQVGKVAKDAVPELIKALKDENRYVRFNAAVALNQIETTEAKAASLRFLYTSRWCPLTTKESTF